MAKKKVAHEGDSFVMSKSASLPRKSVDIKKALNGYVVSTWENEKEKVWVAKDLKEAQSFASKCIKM